MIKARKMKGVLFVKSNIMHIDALCNKGSILLKTPKCRSLVQHTKATTASFSAQNTCSDIKQQIKGSPNYNVWHTAKEFNCWRIIDYRSTSKVIKCDEYLYAALMIINATELITWTTLTCNKVKLKRLLETKLCCWFAETNTWKKKRINKVVTKTKGKLK